VLLPIFIPVAMSLAGKIKVNNKDYKKIEKVNLKISHKDNFFKNK